MSLTERTRLLVEEWSSKSNIGLSKLRLDEYQPFDSVTEDDSQRTDYLPNSVEISIIYSGALDEEFVMDELYAVNVVDDVLAPDCWRECQSDADHPNFQILVNRVSNEHGDLAESEEVYRYDSSSQNPPF